MFYGASVYNKTKDMVNVFYFFNKMNTATNLTATIFRLHFLIKSLFPTNQSACYKLFLS